MIVLDVLKIWSAWAITDSPVVTLTTAAPARPGVQLTSSRTCWPSGEASLMTLGVLSVQIAPKRALLPLSVA